MFVQRRVRTHQSEPDCTGDLLVGRTAEGRLEGRDCFFRASEFGITNCEDERHIGDLRVQFERPLERLCGLGVTTLRIVNRAEVGVDLGNVRSQAGEFPERRAGGVPIFAASACSACCE